MTRKRMTMAAQRKQQAVARPLRRGLEARHRHNRSMPQAGETTVCPTEGKPEAQPHTPPPSQLQVGSPTNPDIQNTRRSNGLSQVFFDQLLEYLHPDREYAGQIYETIRRRLIKFFESRGCFAAIEYADETLNRVAYNLHYGKLIWTEPPKYCLGVARNLLREFWGRPERTFSSLDSLPSHLHPSMNPQSVMARETELRKDEQNLECLIHCLEELSPENREMLIRYYQGEKSQKIENRRRLAAEMGVPLNALRLRVFRLRQELEARFNHRSKTFTKE
jgi:DNA-directed RNA polymerase specialized sigma24 family protein